MQKRPWAFDGSGYRVVGREVPLHVLHHLTKMREERRSNPLLPQGYEHLVGVLVAAVQRTSGEPGSLGDTGRLQVVEAMLDGLCHHRVEQFLCVGLLAPRTRTLAHLGLGRGSLDRTRCTTGSSRGSSRRYGTASGGHGYSSVP